MKACVERERLFDRGLDAASFKIGAVGGGSQRWIDLGFMQLQPSEFMKPTIVLVLATFYHSLPAGMINTWRALVPAGVLIGLPMGLVLLQPDLGTALAIGFGAGLVAAVVIWLALGGYYLLTGHRRREAQPA